MSATKISLAGRLLAVSTLQAHNMAVLLGNDRHPAVLDFSQSMAILTNSALDLSGVSLEQAMQEADALIAKAQGNSAARLADAAIQRAKDSAATLPIQEPTHAS